MLHPIRVHNDGFNYIDVCGVHGTQHPLAAPDAVPTAYMTSTENPPLVMVTPGTKSERILKELMTGRLKDLTDKAYVKFKEGEFLRNVKARTSTPTTAVSGYYRTVPKKK